MAEKMKERRPTVLHRRNMIQGISIAIMLLMCGLSSGWAIPQDVTNDKPVDTGKVESGYAIITPAKAGDSVPTGLVVFETYGEHRMGEVTQAGVLPSDMTTHCILYVSSDGRLSKNLGVAIANPGGTKADVTLMLRDETGKPVLKDGKVITVAAHYQIARFVTELFADQPSVPQNFTGTLDISSKVPIAVAGLRFRGQNFSTLPVTNLSLPVEVPISTDKLIGGPGSVILAHVAIGGGWATEIVIANISAADVTVRVDLFDSTGTAMNATFNGKPVSSFTKLTIPAMGVVTLSQDDKK
jgi:hypothetical protein